jgi:uncharacterized protein
MDVTPLIRQGSKIIQSYAGGSFRISGEVFSGGVIVLQDRVIMWSAPESIAAFSADGFDAAELDALKTCDVILMGTGNQLAFPPPAIRAALKTKGLNIEFMDTGAACRTYNVLMAEGRLVAAALMPLTTKL